MRVKARKQIFENVIEFPVKNAAGEITLFSKEMAPFEHTAPGPINYHVFAADDSKITDTVTLKFQASYDKGETWVDVESNTDLKNGSSGKVSTYKANVLKAAPRVRVEATLSNASRITVDALPGVIVEMGEQEDLERTKVFADIVEFEATAASKTVTGEVIVAEGDVQEVYVVHSGNSAKMTNTTWVLQSSFDGENWWNATTSADISASNFSETAVTTKLGNYFRVVTTLGETGLEAGHGLKFNLITLYY